MTNKKILGICFLVIALAAITFAILCFASETGRYEWDEAYGGDAYTGIQNAAAQTANNVLYMSKCIKKIGGFAFIITGLAFGAIGTSMLLENKESAVSSVAACSDDTIENVTVDE